MTAEAKVSTLLERLDAWLLQQPEYPFLFQADRTTRRQAALLIGKHVMTLPTRQAQTTVVRLTDGGVAELALPNRKGRRDGTPAKVLSVTEPAHD